MLISNKRAFLARSLDGLGVLRLLERTARRRGLLVVTHHRIGDAASSPYYEPVYSATPEAFRAQVRYLRDHFRVVSLDELADGFPSSLREPDVLIAFDDGYRDNFDVAFPILKDLGVPATFFLPTGLLANPRLPWWDHAAFVIKQSQKTRVVLDQPVSMSIDLGPGGPRHEAIRAVIRLYLDDQVRDEPAFRRHLEDRAEVSVDDQVLGRALFMTWDQVRDLVGAGMSIGSHAHTHRKLAALSEDDQRWELTDSRRILERQSGRPVIAVAYPFGWPGTYTELTERLAEASGYRLAFSARPGVNRRSSWDRFALRRVAVGASDSPELFRARTVLYTTFGRSFL